MYLKNLAKPIPLFDQETVVENLQKEGWYLSCGKETPAEDTCRNVKYPEPSNNQDISYSNTWTNDIENLKAYENQTKSFLLIVKDFPSCTGVKRR